MKSEYKVFLCASILASLFCCFYQYFLSVNNYIVYACLVGVYEQENNANGMISSLQQLDYQGDKFQQEDRFVVYNEIYTTKENALKQADDLKQGGFSVVVNEYIVAQDIYQRIIENDYEGMVWE